MAAAEGEQAAMELAIGVILVVISAIEIIGITRLVARSALG